MVGSDLQREIVRQIVALAAAERWPVGRRVSDSALARQLAVSRSPVRSALAWLAERGILRRGEGRGFRLARQPGNGDVEGVAPPSELEHLQRRLMADRATGAVPADVSEALLAERYGAPRGTIRKLLLRFAAEGLVQRQRGHGWAFAGSLDTDRVEEESYQFRLIVECGALRHPGFRADAAELAAIRAGLAEVMAMPLPALHRDRWFEANAAFHEALAAWSGNRFLVQAVRQQNSLRRLTEYAWFDRLPEARIRRVCSEHIAILDAIAEGDIAFAEALLRRHIEGASRSDAA
ncbi:GntR family transcriptional regulator [Labrys wisconsinensis]|uniref:DNA-binding GntR family transcriptional regulator n=1 Tax=Labrys wisconsinensis TaxID=425677 RepID=A0ABU0JLP4_9HYPH|nr:GntR family transcriptional regulator [Labrys wisconsinensis]MDQ0474298.1 DNA-binding GntR family transcriptional regulator [Labrys wisconsinensis]